MIRCLRSKLATVVVAAAVGLVFVNGASAGADVDYSWLPAPSNFVDLRALHDELRVPPLLVEACSTETPQDAAGHFGEDFAYRLLAKVELLRMLDTPSGTMAVHQALLKSADPPDVLQTYNYCIDSATMGAWLPTGSFFISTDPGWKEVKTDFEQVPDFYGVPGTDSIPFCRNGDEGDWDMASAVLLRAWALAKDAFQRVLDPAAFDVLAQHVARVVWLQGGVSAADEAPCGSNFPETENHQFLVEVSRLLHNEADLMLPQADLSKNTSNKWVAGYDTDSNRDNATNGVATRLHAWLMAWASHDFLEYNSRPYSRMQLVGLFDIYDFASDPTLRRSAGVVLDLLAAKVAAESMNLNRTAPYRRRASDNDNLLLGDDQAAAAMQVWIGNMAPTGRPDAFPIGQVMGLAASSNYRPPDVLADIMLNPQHHDYLQAFNGQSQGELAYGSRDFTIAGGGGITPCPYPDKNAPLESTIAKLSLPAPWLLGYMFADDPLANECKGSGNDHGTSQPVVLLPRRLHRTSSTTFPDTTHVIHSTGAASSCIGESIACAEAFTTRFAAHVRPTPDCSLHKDLPSGDSATALRYDTTCAGASYFGQCFFVYQQDISEDSANISYLITHLCDPHQSTAARTQLFQQFIDYETGGDGQPDRPSGCNKDQLGGGFSAIPQTCIWSIELRPPAPYGPIRPAEPVQLWDLENFFYWLTPQLGIAGSSANGTIAELETGIPRLRISDPAAGEWLVEATSGAGTIDASATERSFTWTATVSTHGQVTVTITSADHPEAVRAVRAHVVDETQLQNNCTVVLPNGLKGCYIPNRFCGDPPLPCKTNAPPPYDLASNPYDYDAAPLAHSQPLTLNGTFPTPVGQTHTYAVTACVTWHHFLTAEDYRNDPSGTAQPDAHDSCQNMLLQPIACVFCTTRPPGDIAFVPLRPNP